MIIADSMVTRDDLLKFGAIPAEKVTVIYPGIDPDLGPVTDEEQLSLARQKYDISSPYVIYIGTLQPRKNLVRLIDSFVSSSVDHQLVIAGKAGWLSGPILERLQALSAAEKERIRLPGYIAGEDKGALISGADALLFPSLYEGFGFPLLEGNVCATPVLSSNSSSLPEIANGAALLVDPLDESAITEGIQRILHDEHLRRRLIEAGLNNARRFDWSVAAEKTLDVLETAAG
jgi:glycosyltransferase involved in cell wall biosynthesis